MQQAKKESRIKFLTAQAEYSALSWAISVAVHFLVIAILMFITFYQYDTGTGNEPESFEVQLGVQTPDQAVTASIEPANQQSDSSVVATITTPVITENIIVDTVESSEIVVPVQNIEQAIAPADSSSFAESLAGSDTSGTAGFFGLTAGGTNFIYVIDRSGSMTGVRLATAIDELARSVNSLKENMTFYIIFYDTKYTTMNASSLVPASRSNKSRFLRWAQSIDPQGGTDPTQAMLKAISLKPDSIWLLSDGQFDQAVVDTIKNANKKGVQIHTLAFGSNEGETQLRAVAAQNGGKYRFISIGSNF